MKTKSISLYVLCAVFSSCGLSGQLRKSRDVTPKLAITLPQEMQRVDTVKIVRNAFTADDLVNKADSIRAIKAGQAKNRAVKETKDSAVYGITPVFFEPRKIEPRQEDTAHTTITVKAGDKELFKVKVKQKDGDRR